MSHCALSIISGKRVWKVVSAIPEKLEEQLNELSKVGYEVYRVDRYSSSQSSYTYFTVVAYKIEV